MPLISPVPSQAPLAEDDAVWGDIFSLFGATVGDAFGGKYVTVNYGIMYTAKGAAALLVPLGNVLTHFTGSWHAVYAIGCLMNAFAALLGFLVLKPMIRSRLKKPSELNISPPTFREPKIRDAA
jgi:MFS transporter, OFA family, oxalate/formate antiporter